MSQWSWVMSRPTLTLTVRFFWEFTKMNRFWVEKVNEIFKVWMYNMPTFVVLKITCFNIPQLSLSHITYFPVFEIQYGSNSLFFFFSFFLSEGEYVGFRGASSVKKCFAFKLMSLFSPPCNHKSKVATHPPPPPPIPQGQWEVTLGSLALKHTTVFF